MLNNKRMFKYIIKQLYDGIESSPLEKNGVFKTQKIAWRKFFCYSVIKTRKEDK